MVNNIKQSFLFIVVLAIVFTPIGVGAGLMYMIRFKDWGDFSMIISMVLMTYLWISALYENGELRKKLKDYERKLILKDDSD